MLQEDAEQSLCRWVAQGKGESREFSTSVRMFPAYSKIFTILETVPGYFSQAWHTAGTNSYEQEGKSPNRTRLSFSI